MTDNQTIKERLISFISYLGIGQGKFEKNCGLANAYVANIRKSITPEKLQKIAQRYPELNTGWLMTGEGAMLKSVSPTQRESSIGTQEVATAVLLLPMYAHGGSLNDFVASAKENDCEKVISPISGVDFAIQVSGDSMSPEYSNGSRIFIKKINEKAFIEWGKTYVLDTCNGTVIKRIVPSDKAGFVKCLSINPDPIYAPFEVDLKDVYGIYRVMLCLSIK